MPFNQQIFLPMYIPDIASASTQQLLQESLNPPFKPLDGGKALPIFFILDLIQQIINHHGSVFNLTSSISVHLIVCGLLILITL